MSNGMSSRTRQIVSGLAAIATTALLMSTLVGAFDTQLLTDRSASAQASAITAAYLRDQQLVHGV